MRKYEITRETRRSRNNKVLAVEFDSISEMLKYNKDGKINANSFSEISPASDRRDNERWSQTDSYKHANDLMTEGWSDGSKLLTSTLKIANSKQTDKTVQRAIYDVVGFQASVPRYLQGIPTSMVNKRNIKRKQKTVTLIKSINYHAKVKPKQILDDSVKFLQILQAVEKKGIRVNAYASFHTTKIDEDIFIRTKVKSANERLNLSKMSFPLMHPSFLRRIIFRTMEVDERATLGWRNGYGMPVHDKEDTSELLNTDKEIYIPSLISDEDAKDIVERHTI